MTYIYTCNAANYIVLRLRTILQHLLIISVTKSTDRREQPDKYWLNINMTNNGQTDHLLSTAHMSYLKDLQFFWPTVQFETHFSAKHPLQQISYAKQ